MEKSQSQSVSKKTSETEQKPSKNSKFAEKVSSEQGGFANVLNESETNPDSTSYQLGSGAV